ncbi:hypothetical protein BDZ89DRAFT_596476 [Hymenopellis radicata]|nr:hypothetical protein BDZ89DRAFT_596476 [Hymenopellis radicata]
MSYPCSSPAIVRPTQDPSTIVKTVPSAIASSIPDLAPRTCLYPHRVSFASRQRVPGSPPAAKLLSTLSVVVLQPMSGSRAHHRGLIIVSAWVSRRPDLRVLAIVFPASRSLHPMSPSTLRYDFLGLESSNRLQRNDLPRYHAGLAFESTFSGSRTVRYASLVTVLCSHDGWVGFLCRLDRISPILCLVRERSAQRRVFR